MMRYIVILLVLIPVIGFSQENSKRDSVFSVNSLQREHIVFIQYSIAKEYRKKETIVPVSSLTSLKPIFFKIPLVQKAKEKKVYGYVRSSLWNANNKIGVNVSEVAFVNWNAGGVSSVSGLVTVDLKRTYKTKNIQWKNELLAKYGINKQKDLGIRKTEDNMQLNSTFGYRKDTLSNFYSTVKFNFASQFSNGYEYPDISNKISTIMSPAYLFLGVGTEYGANNENLSIYASPVTVKSTIVLDQKLANKGAFGVEPAVLNENEEIIEEGENVLTQMGILITNEYAATLFENIDLLNKVSLYTDYLDDIGNIDVNWEIALNFQVNDYVLANLGSHLKYDNDIKMTMENEEGELIEIGAITQWKQQLGIGVIVEL